MYVIEWRGVCPESFTLRGCANNFGQEPQLENSNKLPRFIDPLVTAIHMEVDQNVSK